jgi:DNA topoisomerase-6 subunit B
LNSIKTPDGAADPMTTEALIQEPEALKPAGRRASAEAMGAKQRDISVSEFFTKNRHLLGFDNPAKALLTTIKEAVDNALDACEEAGILPTLEVSVEEVSDGRYRVRVEDNGPGIVKEQIPKIFAKLLYGSKFHRLRQSRGQQGIGISAAGMYGHLTTGRPVVVVSKIGKGRPAWRVEVRIDSRTNEPKQLNDKNDTVTWEKDHGTSVEIELMGLYRGGRTSVDAYLEQTVVANPHLELTYKPPKGASVYFPRVSDLLPPEAQEIKPHPHGVELGMLIKILHESGKRHVAQTLMEEFSRVTQAVADELCKRAGIDPNAVAARVDAGKIEALHAAMVASNAALPPIKKFASKVARSDGNLREEVMEEGTGFSTPLADLVIRRAGLEPTLKAKLVTPMMVEKLYESLHESQVKILPPPANCIVPVGEALVMEGLRRRFKGEFFTSHTRPPAVYRGNPFVVEAGIAFGGTLSREDAADVLRFANRVPLLYQPRACAIHEAVLKVDWKSYGLQQRKGELPVGPLAIFVHLASVWVPFTSEAKEAVAHYDEVVREIRLALMECGRKLGTWVKAQQAERWETQRKSLFEKYIVELAASIHSITKVSEESVKKDFEAALPNHVRIAVAPVEGVAPSAAAGAESGAEEGSAEAEASAPESPAPAEARPSDRPPEMSDDGEGSPFEDVTPGNTRQLVLKMRPKSGRK